MHLNMSFLKLVFFSVFWQIFSINASSIPTCVHQFKNNLLVINCNQTDIAIADSIPKKFRRIDVLNLRNLVRIPKNAFQSVQIKNLNIDCQKLVQVDEHAFGNFSWVEQLKLTRIKNLSLFFEDQLNMVKDKVKVIKIEESNLSHFNVIKILNKLKTWPYLESISFDSNSLKHFNYDFDNGFSQLKSLSIKQNFLDYFEIKSEKIKSLNAADNLLTKLNESMFNLKNLEILNVSGNPIEEFNFPLMNKISILYLSVRNLSKNTFKSLKNLEKIYVLQSSTENMNSLWLDEDTFCQLDNLKVLSISDVNLQMRKLNCLQNLIELNLSYCNINGKIDETFLGNANQLERLILEGNNITEINFKNMSKLEYFSLIINKVSTFSNETLKSFPNLKTIALSGNRFSDELLLRIGYLRKLEIFSATVNRFTKIEPLFFKGNLMLKIIHLGYNKIEHIEFGDLDKLESLDLNQNQIKTIKEKSFSTLKNLKYLKLDINFINYIEPKSFDFNQNLININLKINFLTQIPDLSKLVYLNELELSSNFINKIFDYAFERKSNEHNSIIKINLENNPIVYFGYKSFCSRFSKSIASQEIQLKFESILNMNFCMLKQFKSNKTIIKSSEFFKCEQGMMAKHENVELIGDIAQCENNKTINYDCTSILQTDYLCPNFEKQRHSTWIMGSPHIFSFKKSYELCFLNGNMLCFRYKNIYFYCSPSQIDQVNNKYKILNSVEFVYIDDFGKYVNFKANEKIFPKTFDNGLVNILNNDSMPIINLISLNSDLRIIYISNLDIHIFISKWISSYSVVLRASAEIYTNSDGILYWGCPISNSDLSPKRIRESECTIICRNVTSQIDYWQEREYYNIIYQMCWFDCNQFGLNHTELSRKFLQLMKKIVEESDLNPELTTTKTISTNLSNKYNTNFFYLFITLLLLLLLENS